MRSSEGPFILRPGRVRPLPLPPSAALGRSFPHVCNGRTPQRWAAVRAGAGPGQLRAPPTPGVPPSGDSVLPHRRRSGAPDPAATLGVEVAAVLGTRGSQRAGGAGHLSPAQVRRGEEGARDGGTVDGPGGRGGPGGWRRQRLSGACARAPRWQPSELQTHQPSTCPGTEAGTGRTRRAVAHSPGTRAGVSACPGRRALRATGVCPLACALWVVLPAEEVAPGGRGLAGSGPLAEMLAPGAQSPGIWRSCR